MPRYPIASNPYLANMKRLVAVAALLSIQACELEDRRNIEPSVASAPNREGHTLAEFIPHFYMGAEIGTSLDAFAESLPARYDTKRGTVGDLSYVQVLVAGGSNTNFDSGLMTMYARRDTITGVCMVNDFNTEMDARSAFVGTTLSLINNVEPAATSRAFGIPELTGGFDESRYDAWETSDGYMIVAARNQDREYKVLIDKPSARPLGNFEQICKRR